MMSIHTASKLAFHAFAAPIAISYFVYSFVFAVEPHAPSITLPCRILSVHDGDTCTIELTTRANLRLLDCWAPELADGEAGEKAKQRLTQLVEGKAGLVTIPVHDSLGKSFTFGRVLARLRVDDRDVSEVLVSEGHATKEQVR